jgi:hypothetical protein
MLGAQDQSPPSCEGGDFRAVPQRNVKLAEAQKMILRAS